MVGKSPKTLVSNLGCVETPISKNTPQLTIENILNSLSHPFYIIDVNDYTITQANTAAGFGDLTVPTTCYALTHQKDTPCTGENHLCPLREVKRTKQSIVVEHVHYDSEGNIRYFQIHGCPILDDDGEVTQMIEYSIDITDVRNAEIEIRNREDSYRRLAENLPALPYRMFLQEGNRIQLFNDMLNTITGYTLADLKEMKVCSIEQLMVPDDRRNVIHEIKKAITENRHFELEYRIWHRDGTIRWLHERGKPITGSDGKTLYIDGVIFDTTDRKMIEQQLETARKRALLYLDLMGHDVSNQLQIVETSIELLHEIRDTSDMEKLFDDLTSQVVASVIKCKQLIGKAKSTEHLSDTPLTHRELDTILMRCVESARTWYPNVALNVINDVEEPVILADRFLISLFNNLLENAAMHNPKEDKKIWITLQQASFGFEVIIADNGLGINDETKINLFDPTRRFGGVGLHQVKQIIEKYRGRIGVRDRVKGDSSQGTEFAIWFPQVNPISSTGGESSLQI
ncbi:MAG: PAS domain-containing sensor histidine kinase [Candidatus Thorarchaeota archaeon]